MTQSFPMNPKNLMFLSYQYYPMNPNYLMNQSFPMFLKNQNQHFLMNHLCH
jgi:hypothetical protein